MIFQTIKEKAKEFDLPIDEISKFIEKLGNFISQKRKGFKIKRNITDYHKEASIVYDDQGTLIDFDLNLKRKLSVEQTSRGLNKNSMIRDLKPQQNINKFNKTRMSLLLFEKSLDLPQKKMIDQENFEKHSDRVKTFFVLDTVYKPLILEEIEEIFIKVFKDNIELCKEWALFIKNVLLPILIPKRIECFLFIKVNKISKSFLKKSN